MSQAVQTQTQSPASNVAQFPSAPKQDDTAKTIALLKQDAERVVKTVVAGEVKIAKVKKQTREAVQAQINVFIEHGLTLKMLYTGAGENKSVVWAILTSGFEKGGIKQGTIDNYMTRIRRYVKAVQESIARGEKNETAFTLHYLDLYDEAGQDAARAKKGAQTNPKSKSASSESSDGKTEDERVTDRESGNPANPAVQSGTANEHTGLAPLHKFLAAWIEANPVSACKNFGEIRDAVVTLKIELDGIIAK